MDTDRPKGEPVQVGTAKGTKAQARRAEEQTVTEDEIVRRVMDTPHGREFVWSILEKGGMWAEPFGVDSAEGTAYRLGRISLAREVFAQVNDPKLLPLYRLMQDEAIAREQERHEREGTSPPLREQQQEVVTDA